MAGSFDSRAWKRKVGARSATQSELVGDRVEHINKMLQAICTVVKKKKKAMKEPLNLEDARCTVRKELKETKAFIEEIKGLFLAHFVRRGNKS